MKLNWVNLFLICPLCTVSTDLIVASSTSIVLYRRFCGLNSRAEGHIRVVIVVVNNNNNNVPSSVDDIDTGVVVFCGKQRLTNVVGDVSLPEDKLSSGDDQ